VDYAATTSQTVKGASGTGFTYSNLTISGTGLKAADGNITVNGILNLTSNASTTHGSLEMITAYGTYPGRTGTDPNYYSDYGSLSSYTLYMGPSATTTGAGDVTGIVKRDYTIAANTPYTFGNQFTTVSLTDGTMPTSLSVTITLGSTVVGPNNTDIIRDAIKRTYEIIPASNASGSYVTANFHYLDNELTSSINTGFTNTPVKMTTMDYDIGPGGMTVSDEHGRANFDYTNRYIGLSSVPISYFIYKSSGHDWRTIFTLRDYGVGYFTWDGSNNTNTWNDAENWTLSVGGSGIPTTTGHVIIPSAGSTPLDPVLPAGTTTINTLSIESGGVLIMGSSTLKIQNTLSGGWEDQNPSGNDPGTSIVVFNRPNTTISGYARFNKVRIEDGADITNQAGSTMIIQDSIKKTGTGTGKWYADVFSNTVEYSKSGAQTILMPDGTSAYINLTLSGSGTKTLPGAMILEGNFTMDGSAAATAAGALSVAGNVTLASGTTFDGSSYTHSVAGNWTNNGGTFTPGTGTIFFNNTSSAQAINGTAASQTFNNIHLDKGSAALSIGGSTTALTVNDLTESSGNFTAPAALTVNGNAIISSGTFTAGTNTSLKGNWSNNGGTFNDNGGTVTFEGSSTQVINGTNTFHNLTIYKTSSGKGVTANAGQTVNNILYLNSPNHSGTQGCLDMTDPGELIMGASAATTGTGDVTGIVTRNSFVMSTPYTFGNQFTTMKFTEGPLPSTAVSFKIFLTAAEPSWMNTTTGIWRYYDIKNPDAVEATRLAMNLHYLSSELHGAAEDNLDLFDDHVSTATVHDHGRSVAVVNEYVGFSNVGLRFLSGQDFGERYWSLGTGLYGNTSTWIGGSPSGPTDWNLPGNWQGGVPTATSDVHIPATTYAPVLPDGSTTILSIEILSGGILNATTGTPTLTISGNSGAWVDQGAFNAGNSTIAFTGSTADMSGSTYFYNVTVAGGKSMTLLSGNLMGIDGTLTISGALNAASYPNTIDFRSSGLTIYNNPSGSPTGYYNLIVSGTSASAGEAITALGNFTVNSGAGFTAGSFTHSIAGNFTNNGTFTGTGSTITCNGTAAQSIGGTSATTFANLTSDNASGVTLTSSELTTVTGTLLINSGKKFEIAPAKQLTVSGTLTNSGGNSGFISNSDASGTGSLIANNSKPIWPEFAPLPTANSFGIAPWNWDFYYWNPKADTTSQLYWVNLRKDSEGNYNNGEIDHQSSNAGYGPAIPKFTVGRGYLAAYNTGWTTGSPDTHSFTGTLNSAEVEKSVTTGVNSWNLVGNPFPSSIDWQATSGWARSNLVASGDGFDMWIYNAAAGNYGVCNSAGGDGTNFVSKDIPPMQAFFVKVASGTTITMGTGVKVHSNQGWLKNTADADNSLRLALTTSANSFCDEMIVAVNPAYENSGSWKFWSMYPEAPEIYSIKNSVNYSIDRLPSVSENSVVILGIKAGLDGSHTIAATGADNFNLAKSIILEDLKTGLTQDLKTEPSYTFTSSPADNPERFHLHFGGPYGIGDQVNRLDFTIFSFNNSLVIKNVTGKNIEGNVYVCNILGQKIAQQRILDLVTSINLNTTPGWYIVTLVTNSKTYSKKVFIH
ncbi:MAG: T9SS type A sorting domain-containing protein, partial [Bacteroidetes bacterium]|nr:T9SS type A sorting domain-containing protein [Bacteroidota bacterium]